MLLEIIVLLIIVLFTYHRGLLPKRNSVDKACTQSTSARASSRSEWIVLLILWEKGNMSKRHAGLNCEMILEFLHAMVMVRKGRITRKNFPSIIGLSLYAFSFLNNSICPSCLCTCICFYFSVPLFSFLDSLPTTILPPFKECVVHLCNYFPRPFIFLPWLLYNFKSIFQACGWQSTCFCPLLVLFLYRVLLCSSGWLRTHYEDQAWDLNLGGSPCFCLLNTEITDVATTSGSRYAPLILLTLRQNMRKPAMCWLEHHLVPVTSGPSLKFIPE